MIRDTDRDVRWFGALFLVVSAIVEWASFRRGHPWPSLLVAGALGVVGVLALVAPGRARPLYRAWMELGRRIGLVTTPIVLAVIYFGVITPMRIVLWIVRKEVLALRRDPRATSYWVERTTRRFEPRDFERMG
ncbi:MAG: hypothetical protein HYV09_15160 [Deltaproteobacteria bacterium]|nr:hypothetical protein [Deltaproteobacteria bacterium]